jgi:hypothetical protein
MMNKFLVLLIIILIWVKDAYFFYFYWKMRSYKLKTDLIIEELWNKMLIDKKRMRIFF